MKEEKTRLSRMITFKANMYGYLYIIYMKEMCKSDHNTFRVCVCVLYIKSIKRNGMNERQKKEAEKSMQQQNVV